MRFYCVAIALAFVAASASNAHAESKRIPQPQTQSAQQQTTADQRGTENSPVVVKILPSPEAKEKADSAAKEHDEKRQFDGDTLFLTKLTVAIIFFQLLIFGWQGWQLKRTVSATKEVVDLGNKEFIATHRPKIRIKHLWLERDVWQGEPVRVKLTCVNHGTATAFLQEVGIEFYVIKEGRMLPEPKINATYKAGAQYLECGVNYEFPPYDGIILTPEQNSDVQSGRSKLFCVGYVSYLDMAKRMRITGFCRVLKFPQPFVIGIHNSRFRKFDDPDYEYAD